MEDALVVSILSRADAADCLPRLGGMARPDGVFIAGGGSWSFSSSAGAVTEGGLPKTPSFSSVPLLRGVVRLAAALSPIFKLGRSGGRREAPVFAAALALPVLLAFLPVWLATPGSIVVGSCFVLWLFRGRTLFLHGAEHRAIAAAESRSLLATWQGVARPSRFALRCGTNFAVLALPIAYGFQELWPFRLAIVTPIALSVLSLGFAMELWQAVQAAPRRLARIVLCPGLALQRLTTQEPTLEETRVALRALSAVLVRELPELATPAAPRLTRRTLSATG